MACSYDLPVAANTNVGSILVTVELRYKLAQLPFREFEGKLDQLWEELKRDSPLRLQAESAGIDLSPLRLLERDQAITVREDTERQQPGAVSLIVSFPATFGADLWINVLLARLEQEADLEERRIQEQS